MTNSFDIIVTRALNSTKKVSIFSYYALRLLLEKKPSSKNLHWLEKTIKRKITIRQNWRYFQFKMFKNFENDKPIYRTISAPSPLTALTEAYMLEIASKYECFKPAKQVYSYLWPDKESSAYSFLYYHEGYQKRNNRIYDLMNLSLKYELGLHALILDIKNFYPSIQKTDMLNKFLKKLDSIDYEEDKELLKNYTMQLFRDTGIPVGPEFSHFLANIFLEELDQNLIKRFEDQYFRYVDDLIILIPKNDEEKVLSYIKDLLPEYIKLNEEKYDFISDSDWINAFKESEKINFNEFHIFLNKIVAFLMHEPTKYEELKDTFITNGFTIPFSKIYAQSRNKKHFNFFRFFQRNFLKKTKNITINDLMLEGRRISANYLNALIDLPKISDADIGIKRKWLIQKYKFLINRLIYLPGTTSLKNQEKYKSLRSLIPENIEEFRQNKVFLDALITHDATELINYTGATVLSFCEQSLESGIKNITLQWEKIILDETITTAQQESILILLLFELINDDPINCDKYFKNDFYNLYTFVLSKQAQISRIKNEYIKEIAFLSHQQSKHEKLRLLLSKYNEQESFDLRALSLEESSS